MMKTKALTIAVVVIFLCTPLTMVPAHGLQAFKISYQPSSNADTSYGYIAGYVKKWPGGEPLENITIEAANGRYYNTFTNENGYYEMKVEAGYLYSVMPDCGLFITEGEGINDDADVYVYENKISWANFTIICKNKASNPADATSFSLQLHLQIFKLILGLSKKIFNQPHYIYKLNLWWGKKCFL